MKNLELISAGFQVQNIDLEFFLNNISDALNIEIEELHPSIIEKDFWTTVRFEAITEEEAEIIASLIP